MIRLARLNLLLTVMLAMHIQNVAAAEFVSVGDSSAILYDAPSIKAKKQFVVNRFMPFEKVVTLESWIKVRDRSGQLYWIEKRNLSKDRYVYALLPLVSVRDTPDASGKQAFQVKKKVALQLLESTGTGWLRVRHQDGNVGYVRSSEVWGD